MLAPLAYLLPFLEQTAVSNLITTNMSVDEVAPYWGNDGSSVAAARTRIKTFVCPSTQLYGPNPGFIAGSCGLYLSGVDITGWENSTSETILSLGRTNYLGVAGYAGNAASWNISSTNAAKIGVPAGTPGINFEGVFTTRSKTRLANITDGSSNTLLVGEVMGGKAEGDSPHASFTWIGAGLLPTFTGLKETDGSIRRHWSSFNSDHTAGIVNFVLADASVRRISPQIDYGAYIMLGGMRDGMQFKSEALQ